MKVKKILIFTTEPFPIGMAATNRILSYAKGFIFHGIEVEVVCVSRTESNKKKIHNVDVRGSFEGVKFLYLSKSTLKLKNFYLRRKYNILSYFSLFLYSFRKIDRNTGSIYYGTKSSPALILWFTNKIKRGVLLKDESEHPDVRNKNFPAKFIFKNIHFKLFDGFLLITKNLISYFSSISNTPSLHVPMTVELDRFRDKSENVNSEITIVYTGWLHDKKDGINILIAAFAEVVKDNDHVQLYLYGPAQSPEQMNRYKDLVKKLNIDQLAHFKGKISRQEITRVILDAKILVLPRPDSLQAQNGFPTKLGEYLATGNPTIVTRVGEIPYYLEDGVSSYIAEPGSVESLIEKFKEIINDYPKALETGANGKKVAQKHFSNIIQTKKVVDFIEKLGGQK